jgi:hypothetical protein
MYDVARQSYLGNVLSLSCDSIIHVFPQCASLYWIVRTFPTEAADHQLRTWPKGLQGFCIWIERSVCIYISHTFPQ